MFTYLILVSIALFSGLGVLKLSRAEFDWPSSLYLAPILTISIWSLFVGCGVLWGYSVEKLWPFGYLITAVLAAYGLLSQFDRLKEIDIVTLILVVLLPATLMFPYFFYGIFDYIGGPALDGWSYSAFGCYIWSYPLGTEGGLAPLYQYSAHMAKSRFIASGLQAFLSPLTGMHGDARLASGLFVAICFFVFASSIMFFAGSRRLGRRLSFIYVGSTLFSVWMFNLIKSNNYDNALAISFLPVFAGMQRYMRHDNLSCAVLLALLAAAQTYIYPEMAPLCLSFAALFVVQRAYFNNVDFRRWKGFLLTTLILFVVFSCPWGSRAILFFSQQLNSSANSIGLIRPGQNSFPELLVHYNWMANMWGLYVPTQGPGVQAISLNVVGLFYSALAVIGMVNLVKHRDWIMVLFVVTIWFGASFMVFKENYDYGAYKILNMGWWASSFVVFCGVAFLISRWQSTKVIVFLKILLVVFLANTGLKIIRFDKSIYPKSIVYYEQVRDIKNIVGDKIVLAHIDDVAANQWAVYFLRDLNVIVDPYRGYMAQTHVIPYMDRTRKLPSEQISYLLTDSKVVFPAPQKDPIWRGDKYKLWNVESPQNEYAVYSITNPNGLEKQNGDDLLWIGGQETRIDLWSGQNGSIVLTGALASGPSISVTQERRVLFSTDNGFQKILEFDGTCNLVMEVPVRKGNNRILVRALDNPNISLLPNGDTRPLVVKASGMALTKFLPGQ